MRARSASPGSRAYWQITNFFWLLPPPPADETACTWQPHLRPGCCLHAVSSLYAIIVRGPLTPWLHTVTIQVCTQTRASHLGTIISNLFHAVTFTWAHHRDLLYTMDCCHDKPWQPHVWAMLLAFTTCPWPCCSPWHVHCHPHNTCCLPFSLNDMQPCDEEFKLWSYPAHILKCITNARLSLSSIPFSSLLLTCSSSKL